MTKREKKLSDMRLLKSTFPFIILLLSVTASLAQPAELMHYWNFNDQDNPAAVTFTTGSAGLTANLAGASEIESDTGQDFTGANARMDDEAGAHLRLNNPLGSSLIFFLPTTGKENIIIKYETRRSGQGAGVQLVSYTTDGTTFTSFASITTYNAPPAVQTLDFTDIPQVNNNPFFAVKIEFEAGDGGEGGNNRFDNFTVESFDVIPKPVLIHYWNFNDTAALTAASFTLGVADLGIELGPETEVLAGSGQDFIGANARFGEEAGSHLRVNNPLGASLMFTLSTTGFEYIRFMYETRRSGQGAGEQEVFYTTDGENFTHFRTITVFDDMPVLHEFNFSGIEEAGDNADFAILITFEQGAGGIAGNNRFDNVTLEGMALEETNSPPVVTNPIDMFTMIAPDDEVMVDMTDVFTDPDGDELTFTVENSRESVAGITREGNVLGIRALYQGESEITINADDGVNPQVSTTFRVLVYPEAHILVAENGAEQSIVMQNFYFSEWDPEEPAGSFPGHMIFMQSDMDDPGLNDPLLFAYDVPENDYQADDLPSLGFPYMLTRRTRINGLGEGGVSFINTGRERDLGSAIAAIDTRNAERVTVQWTGGTVLPNSRVYHIRLQYRAGIHGEFSDLMSDGSPVEYIRNETGGHSIDFEPVELPQELLDLPYVQLQWKYYFTGVRLSEESGARDQLRIADITIEATPPTSIDGARERAGRISLDQNYPNPFNPATSIRFEIPEPAAVTLEVYDMLGQLVATIADGQYAAGSHLISFNATALSSGVYIYRLEAGGQRITRKMTLVK
ncbi:MAG: T9SS C-terminal target domain-containing protein [Balneolaceae bacterium]|nr:MAG: T9SS C-terminal target domain-containing protein [Balneolaceae bacterium]